MRLAGDEIAVWTVALDRDGAPDCLTPDERARAAAAVDPAVRRRRIHSRSALRQILGVYVDVPPCELRLVVDGGGKPRLEQGPHFNLSHSADTMLLAVSSAGPVGVDLERIDRLDSDWLGVSGRVFSAGERGQLSRMPEAERPAAFLRGWVRKEAYAKARGAGFAYGFTAFTVSLEPGAGASCLIADDKDAGAAAAWRLCDIGAPEGFAASLAHEGTDRVLTYRSWGEAA